MNKTNAQSSQPDLDIRIPVPVPSGRSLNGVEAAVPSLDLTESLCARGNSDRAFDFTTGVVDILGSAVAMASGWIPPAEEEER